MKVRSLSLIAFALLSSTSQALITLTHNGSVVTIDETSGTTTNWFIGGVDQLFQHRYYFRVGDTTGADLVSTIGAPVVTLFGLRGAEVVYTNADLRVTLTYMLTGSTNGMTADLLESALVENLSGSKEFRLFQYSDYDMNGTPDNDTGQRQNSSTITVWDNDLTMIQAVEGGTPIPEFTEISNSFPDLRDDIEGTAGYNLNTAAGDGLGETMTGDIAYALQWNRTLAQGSAFLVSTDTVVVVPEPATMAALGLGLAALVARRRRKSA